MSDQIAKGEEFEKKAEKKIKGWGLFGSKYEDAAELYEKSANSFKLAKSCTLLLNLSLFITYINYLLL
jgi:alpha-soluble NSF attachment protein